MYTDNTLNSQADLIFQFLVSALFMLFPSALFMLFPSALIILIASTSQADITVVGHRSTMLFAPENTLAAISKAIELGVDILEMDIRQTKDGELVILHDETVDRTTNGHGAIRDLNLTAVKALDAGSHFSKTFKNERIPTLREALRLMKGRARPDIDFKEGNLDTLKKNLIEEGFFEQGQTTFLGGDREFQNVKTWDVLLIRPTSMFAVLSLANIVQTFDPPIVNIPEFYYSKSYINAIRKSGRKSWVNVILNRVFEEQRLHRVVDGRPDYIQTDRADILIPYLRSLGLHK